MILYIVRHGKTLENDQKIIMGQRGGTLSEEGLKQAKLLGKKFKKIPIDVTYCSDLKRAKDTLQDMRNISKNIPKAIYSKDITEINFGEYEGINWNDFKLYDSKKTMMSVKPKGGESLCEVKNRVAEFIKMLHERHKKESVLIITHGGIILTIVSILLKTPLERLYGELHFNNACICKLTISETGKTKMRHLC